MQTKLKLGKTNIKVRAQWNRKTRKPKAGSLKKINKIKPSARLTKTKTEKIQIAKIRNEKRVITTKRIITTDLLEFKPQN